MEMQQDNKWSPTSAWGIAVGCGAMAFFSMGLGLYGLGVYLRVFHVDYGWSESLLSIAATAFSVLVALAMPAMGGVLRRYGARRVMTFGGLALGVGVAMLGRISSPWELFGCYLLMAAGAACLGSNAIGVVVMPWFTRRRGMAMTIALSGMSLGGMLLVPVLVWSTSAFGFRTTTTLLGSAAAVCIAALALFLIRSPRAGEVEPEATHDFCRVHKAKAQRERSWSRVEVMRTRAFWTMLLPFTLAWVAQFGFVVHQLSLSEVVVGPARAAFAVSLTTFAALAGRLLISVFADRMDRRALCGVVFALQGAGLLLIALCARDAALYVGSIAIGLGFGNTVTLPPLIVADEFGTRSFADVYGLVAAVTMLGGAMGPSIVGFLSVASGGYVLPLLVLSACTLVAGIGIVQGGRDQDRIFSQMSAEVVQ